MEETNEMGTTATEMETPVASQQAAAGSGEKPYLSFQDQGEVDAWIGKRLGESRKLKESLSKLMEQYGASSEDELMGKLLGTGEVTPVEKEETIPQKKQVEDDLLFALTEEVKELRAYDEQLYSDVDAKGLLADRKFLDLVAGGFGVKEAYDACHAAELLERGIRRERQSMVSNLVTRGGRPMENAMVSAPYSSQTAGVAALSDEEIATLAQRARKGQKIIL